METMSDTQLVVLSQEGSRRAFGLVAKRQQGALYRFLRRLLGDEEEARDACQETLLKAFLDGFGFDGDGPEQLVLKVKMRDLRQYSAGQLSLDQARARVSIEEK